MKFTLMIFIIAAFSLSAGHHEGGNTKDWEIKTYSSAALHL